MLAGMRQRWLWSDTIALVLVTCVAGAIRGLHLSRLPFIYSDEMFYAREACIDVFRSRTLCGIPIEAVSAHPPMGKWLIGLGVRALGWNPVGWRIAAVLAGTATVALVYLLARRVLNSPLGATLAAGLLAIDFLHIVQSRIAMLDVFLTLFVVSAFLFVVLDRDEVTQPVFRPWLMAAGVASGAAVATKWVGLCALFGAAALWWILPAARSSGERFSVALMRVVRREWLPMVFAFVAVPAIVYVASYTTRIPGSVLALPWQRGAWIRTFAGVQREMLHFHRHSSEIRYVGLTNRWVSPAWSWPLIKRPFIYYGRSRPDGNRETVVAMGNPLVWWASLAALPALALGLRRSRSDAAIVAVVGFGATYLPLLLLSRVRAATFLYYMLPSVPFMGLAIATVLVGWLRSSIGRWIALTYAVAVVGMFVFFLPVLVASPLSQHELDARQWFRDCRPAAGIAAPEGWCWR